MIRGTTPTFTLQLHDEAVDLTQAINVYATFRQASKSITKSGSDLTIEPNDVYVYLSQEETLQFTAGKIDVQLNWTYTDGRRACSNIITVQIGENLIGSVIE